MFAGARPPGEVTPGLDLPVIAAAVILDHGIGITERPKLKQTAQHSVTYTNRQA